MDRFRSGVLILGLALGIVAALGTTYPYTRKEASETVTGRWAFSDVIDFTTKGANSPLKLTADYTMTAPSTGPTVITSGSVAASCSNAKSYEWYTAKVNEGGVTALSPASVAWVPSPNLRKATITRTDTPSGNEKGWLLYSRV